MKSISDELLTDLMLYHLLGQRDPDLESRIVSALEAKATSMLRRQEYAQMLKKKTILMKDTSDE